jgi:peroxiredoxin
MQTLQEQTSAQVEKTRQAKPEYMKALDNLIDSASKYEEGKNAIKIGKKAPDFKLPNVDGKIVTLSELLADGAVILSFYRGSWCPYCNLELKALQSRLSKFNELKAKLVMISPQMPDESLSKEEKEKLEFLVLSDQGAVVASKYGVAWEVPEFILEHMKKDRDLDLAKINNGKRNILPIPATFVIGKDGVVAWQYTSVDFRTRSEPDDIIKALKELKKDKELN